jgi:hypothetical protein
MVGVGVGAIVGLGSGVVGSGVGGITVVEGLSVGVGSHCHKRGIGVV